MSTSNLPHQVWYDRAVAGETLALPLSQRVLWSLSGPDRVRYLNGQVTNDVAKLPPGQVLYAASTTAKGKMVGDLFAAAGPEALLIDAAIELADTLGPRLEKYLIADDAVFEEATEMRLTHVLGRVRPAETAGRLVFPNCRFGLPGFDVWQTGETYAEGDVIPSEELSAALQETLRMEHAYARWGADMDENTLPPEAGLEARAISYTKGCYVGQETIARIKSIGHVNRQLRPLLSTAEVTPGVTLKAGEKDAGRVTSCGYSPALKGWLALGYVQRAFLEGEHLLDAGGAQLKVIPPPRQSA